MKYLLLSIALFFSSPALSEETDKLTAEQKTKNYNANMELYGKCAYILMAQDKIDSSNSQKIPIFQQLVNISANGYAKHLVKLGDTKLKQAEEIVRTKFNAINSASEVAWNKMDETQRQENLYACSRIYEIIMSQK